MKLNRFKKHSLFIVFLICLIPVKSRAYSVLTHEAVIDASWEKSIKLLLKNRYPKATEADLLVAHSYAYGGSLMADIGYSPFGNADFTNLIHYVRSGDFVSNLIAESQNLNEFAYSLGALCHYMADKYGHSVGTNYVVPMMYPKVKEKYGQVVTYEQNHTAHSRVEIAFDVLQIARGNYASQAYHDFIGFNVAKPVLERAFLKTYGQNINALLPNLDRSVNNFRWAINSLMPTLTRSAWVLKKDEIKKNEPGITSHKFHYRMRRKKYYEEFGHDRDKPKFKEQLIAFFLKIVPKVGPFKIFKFKPIDHEGEKQFIKSFDTVMNEYANALAQLNYKQPHLPNVDFDTGGLTAYGEYELADDAYDKLVDQLNENKFVSLTLSLKNNIIDFYSKADTAALAKAKPAYWKKTSTALGNIKLATPKSVDSLKVTSRMIDSDTVVKQ